MSYFAKYERFGVLLMKKICVVLLALAFVFATASVALAAVSPVAPTIEHIETTTKAPTTVAPTTTQQAPADKTTTAAPTTTQKGEVDETTTKVADTTTKPVESDTNPSSPDTGVAQTLGKASAAAAVVLVLSAAGVYTSKKKVTE